MTFSALPPNRYDSSLQDWSLMLLQHKRRVERVNETTTARLMRQLYGAQLAGLTGSGTGSGSGSDLAANSRQ